MRVRTLINLSKLVFFGIFIGHAVKVKFYFCFVILSMFDHLEKVEVIK